MHDLDNLIRYFVEGDNNDLALSGGLFGEFFSKYHVAIGIVLILVAVGIVYFAVKIFKGYSFHVDETVITDDKEHFITVKAKITDSKQTEIPSFSKSSSDKNVFKEILIKYEVNGETYQKWVSDYALKSDSDFVTIKYDPDNPENFFIHTEDADLEKVSDENNNPNIDEEKNESKNKIGFVLIILSVLVLLAGIGILLN